MLYIVHFTAFCLGGPFFSGHGVDGLVYHCALFATINKKSLKTYLLNQLFNSNDVYLYSDVPDVDYLHMSYSFP